VELEVCQAALINETTTAQIQFTPAAYFDEWLESIEAFRERQRQPAAAEISIDGEDLDFETAFGFDNALDKIENPGALILAEHGSLQADIVVSSALISGVLRGNITASESVVIENHAVVIGDINTPRLTIRGGAIIDGECYFQGVQEPEPPPVWSTEPPPVWSALKGGLVKVWRTRLFQ
jgi:hypothetical protein